jgi:hypothetical protein
MQSVTGKVPETRSLGRARVSGKLLPIEIVDVIWQENTAGMTSVMTIVRRPEAGPAAAAETKAKLKLRHRGRLVELDENSPTFMMGREAANNLVVEADWVSRSHAQIEFKKGYFTITDRSTNATFVRFGEDDEMKVHRDEAKLRKTGTISLGQSVAINVNDVIYFEAEGEGD